jgi:hypothetical protein
MAQKTVFKTFAEVFDIAIAKGMAGASKKDKNTRYREFLESFCKISEWNSFLDKSPDTAGCRPTLLAIIMKCVLDIDDLRQLCLMPPKGCPLEKWHCMVGYCQSLDKMKSQNPMALKACRFLLGKKDELPHRFYEKYQELWEPSSRINFPNRHVGQLSPLILFPIKQLHPKVKEFILTEKPEHKDRIDEFFVCTDHFTPNLRNLFSYSIEYLNTQLEAGSINFSFARRGLQGAHAMAVQNLINTTFSMAEFTPFPTKLVEEINVATLEKQITNAFGILSTKMSELQNYINQFGLEDSDLLRL